MKEYIYNYITRNRNNGMAYVGTHSTDNLYDGYLGSGKLLCRAIRKIGKIHFICTILCFHDNYRDAYDREMRLIEEYETIFPRGYNISPSGGVAGPKLHSNITLEKLKGRKLSEEVKEKLRKFHTGRRQSEETRKKIGEAGLGRKHSAESKQKMREKKLGIARPSHVIEALRNANLGRPLSEDHKRKISEANKGQIAWNKGRRATENIGITIRESKKHKIMSEEHKRKIGKANRGRVWSEESKLKNRLAQLTIFKNKAE